jgi:hypothetical protein
MGIVETFVKLKDVLGMTLIVLAMVTVIVLPVNVFAIKDGKELVVKQLTVPKIVTVLVVVVQVPSAALHSPFPPQFSSQPEHPGN